MRGSEASIAAIPWVARENRRFLSILRGMDAPAWERPTFCPMWSAAEVVAHMTLGARFYAHVIPAGCAGRLDMPFGASDLESFWAYRDRAGRELAALPGAERVDRFEEAVNRLQKIFEGIRPEDLEKNAWHWMRPCPIHSFPGQRLYELLLHEWDIRFEPNGSLHPDALGIAVDILDFRLPFFFNHAPDPSLDGAFRFKTSSPGRAWALKARGGRAEPCSPDREEFDARFFATASDILLLTTGRADPKGKEASGDLRIEGNRDKAEALLNVLCRPF